MKPTVLFVNLPTVPYFSLLDILRGRTSLPQRIEMPLGIMYLSSCLKERQLAGQIDLLDYPVLLSAADTGISLEEFIEQPARQLSFKPDVLAFSLSFSTSHEFFIQSLKILKSLWPEAVSVVGGNHATNTAKYLLQIPQLDYVALGEGEGSFCEFVRALDEGQRPKIVGIYSRDYQESSLELGPSTLQLDDLPLPDWDLVDMDVYLNSKGRKRSLGESKESQCATIMTTRGCPFQCTFCAAHTVHGRRVRYRSIANVLSEMRTLYERFGVTLFVFEDDMFSADLARTKELLAAIRNLGIPGLELQFPNALSVNTLSEDLLDEMIASGMKIASLAIESGSEYVQRHIIKKNCNLRKARQLVAYLRQKGIVVRCFYIFGFPGETIEYMKETVEYARSLKADWSAFNIATPLVGSEMYNQFIARGNLSADSESWSNASYGARLFDTAEISAAALNAFVYRTNLEINFIYNPNLLEGNFRRAEELFQDVVSLYPFHLIAWYSLWRCYQTMGNIKKTEQVEGKIQSLVSSDVKAQEMLQKYGDLMKDFQFKESLSR